jgi:hypothetical protein
LSVIMAVLCVILIELCSFQTFVLLYPYKGRYYEIG